MSISGDVNGELRRRFEQFKRFGAPGQYVNLPHGFRAEIAPEGDINLYHTDCPSYPMRIGTVKFSPYRWELAWNWDKAAVALVRMLKLEVDEVEEVLPY